MLSFFESKGCRDGVAGFHPWAEGGVGFVSFCSTLNWKSLNLWLFTHENLQNRCNTSMTAKETVCIPAT